MQRTMLHNAKTCSLLDIPDQDCVSIADTMEWGNILVANGKDKMPLNTPSGRKKFGQKQMLASTTINYAHYRNAGLE